jgi:hypothetical protein
VPVGCAIVEFTIFSCIAIAMLIRYWYFYVSFPVPTILTAYKYECSGFSNSGEAISCSCVSVYIIMLKRTCSCHEYYEINAVLKVILITTVINFTENA